jgi:hypothetical protein
MWCPLAHCVHLSLEPDIETSMYQLLLDQSQGAPKRRFLILKIFWLGSGCRGSCHSFQFDIHSLTKVTHFQKECSFHQTTSDDRGVSTPIFSTPSTSNERPSESSCNNFQLVWFHKDGVGGSCEARAWLHLMMRNMVGSECKGNKRNLAPRQKKDHSKLWELRKGRSYGPPSELQWWDCSTFLMHLWRAFDERVLRMCTSGAVDQW